MYGNSYPVNNLLMGSGSQIIVPAEEQQADKGKLLAYETDIELLMSIRLGIEKGWRTRKHHNVAGRSLSQIWING